MSICVTDAQAIFAAGGGCSCSDTGNVNATYSWVESEARSEGEEPALWDLNKPRSFKLFKPLEMHKNVNVVV